MDCYSDVFLYVKADAGIGPVIDAFNATHPQLGAHYADVEGDDAFTLMGSTEVAYRHDKVRWQVSRNGNADRHNPVTEWLDQFWQWCESGQVEGTSGCFLRAVDVETAEDAYWGHPSAWEMVDLPFTIAVNSDFAARLDAAGRGSGKPVRSGEAAGLPLMDTIIDVLNDRGFSDQPLLPDVDTVTDWYVRIVGPALDRIEAEIVADPEVHGILDDELVPERFAPPPG